MPSASRRSVLIGIAFRAPFTCRVSTLHLPRFQQHDGEAGLAHVPVQPLRERAGLEADNRNLAGERTQGGDQGLRFAVDLRLLHHFAMRIQGAERRACQRDIKSNKQIHVVVLLPDQGIGARLTA